MKRVLVATGGGDCPGLNAVIRGIVKRASQEKGWEIIGSRDAYNGLLSDPMELIPLDNKTVSGIHVRGGTIIGTTNKGGPFAYPIKQPDGTWKAVDRSDEMIKRLQELNIEAIISIGGDGSQRISQKLFEKGVNIVGVPKTIDNDLSATDFTFGFQTAVQIATESFDRLVTTAESHHRIMIMEVMGRDAGWIALHTAIAGGAEVCLIPEIPYDIQKVAARLNERFQNGRGFAHVVVAEGAKPKEGTIVARKSDEIGYENVRLGGIALQLSAQLKQVGVQADIRETILGHTQRGGTPIAFDRVLATMFGVKAFEMVLNREYGKMVAYRNNTVVSVSLTEATGKYNHVKPDSYLIHAARGVGICFGD
ncbi:MAG: ATP-dependent 6-phosphofructokinase [Cytophagales bacterium]|nr:ATP-dependent 6-phosphofructokinase [Cytophagales bacterium]MDW8384700.1 ATP-dependent 6-phosphofructokinase [Flammeovirgaceae bacterium]